MWLSQADEASDQRLARHLTSLFHEDIPEHAKALIPLEELKEYVAFARSRVQPVIGDEAAPLLAQGYLDMRLLGQDPSGNVNKCVARSDRASIVAFDGRSCSTCAEQMARCAGFDVRRVGTA